MTGTDNMFVNLHVSSSLQTWDFLWNWLQYPLSFSKMFQMCSTAAEPVLQDRCYWTQKFLISLKTAKFQVSYDRFSYIEKFGLSAWDNSLLRQVVSNGSGLSRQVALHIQCICIVFSPISPIHRPRLALQWQLHVNSAKMDWIYKSPNVEFIKTVVYMHTAQMTCSITSQAMKKTMLKWSGVSPGGTVCFFSLHDYDLMMLLRKCSETAVRVLDWCLKLCINIDLCLFIYYFKFALSGCMNVPTVS